MSESAHESVRMEQNTMNTKFEICRHILEQANGVCQSWKENHLDPHYVVSIQLESSRSYLYLSGHFLPQICSSREENGGDVFSRIFSFFIKYEQPRQLNWVTNHRPRPLAVAITWPDFSNLVGEKEDSWTEKGNCESQ